MAKLEHRKILVGIFLNAVYIYNDHMDITFNYKEGTKTINFSDMECALSRRASIPDSDLEFSGVPNLTVEINRFYERFFAVTYLRNSERSVK